MSAREFTLFGRTVLFEGWRVSTWRETRVNRRPDIPMPMIALGGGAFWGCVIAFALGGVVVGLPVWLLS